MVYIQVLETYMQMIVSVFSVISQIWEKGLQVGL